MKNARVPLWLTASMVLATALALFSVAQRHRVEARNKAVGMAVEIEILDALAASQGLSVPEAMERLKLQGLTAVVLGEETVADLEASRELELVRRGRGVDAVASNRQVADRLARGVHIRFGAPGERSAQLLRGTSLGLDPDDAAMAKRAGLMVVGRFANPAGMTSAGVRSTLQWGRQLGVDVFLPVGDQVLGRRDSIDATIDAIKEFGLLYATPEFTKIGGDATVVAAVPERVLRLHSAQTAELDKLPYIDAVERYGKSARERNMRLLLVRPVSQSGDAPLTDFGAFLKAIGDQVRAEGGQIGTARPFTAPELPRFWPMLIALAAMPMAWFGAAALIESPRLRQIGAVLLLLLALAAWTKTGTQAAAFVISLTAPLAGYAVLARWLAPADRPSLPQLLLGFLLVSAFSVVGGLCIAGMLNGLSYYIAADEFRGVKLSVFLPVLLVGALFFAKSIDWRSTLRSPITWGTAALGFTILAGLAIMVMRSGNDTGAGASDLELAFRNLLDRFLYVRPRTKEFLVGHPLLVVGIGLLAAARTRKASDPLIGWAILVLMVSAVGQTSVVNTLTHAHIPVVLSIVRVVEGLAIGCIIGLGMWLVVNRFALRKVD